MFSGFLRRGGRSQRNSIDNLKLSCIMLDVNKKGYKWFSKEEISSWPKGTKKCRRCLEIKPFKDFHKHKHALFGINTECKSCRAPKSFKDYHAKDSKQLMYERAKSRAELKGVEFTISKDDIVVPDVCPVFNIPFQPKGKFCASLDRIDSKIGYIPGNIAVITNFANMIKNNATPDELMHVALWAKSVTTP